MERRLFLRLLLHETGDLAKLSRHPGLDEDGLPSPAVDGGPHEHHVLAVAQEGLAGLRLDGLAHGERLAGQGGLVDAEARHFEEPSVRGDPVSRRKDDDLAGHQIAGWHGNDPALPQDVGLRCGEALQGFERSFRPILLDEAEDRVHDHDHDDQHGVVQVGGLSLEES